MWKQKIGISLGNHYGVPTTEVIDIIKQVGYEAISPEWEEDADIGDIVKKARDCGLILQAMHGPYRKAAQLWSEDESVSLPAKREIFSALDSCAEFGIPLLVLHAWIGFEYTFNNDDLYFDNFDEIVSYAAKRNIKIAFENTEGVEYLFALMERYKDDDNVGYCWDSGHELCYNSAHDLLDKYGDRLIMTHINDNLGVSRYDGKIYWTDDLHLLPYDGIADWDYNVARLKKSKPMDILNFELNIYSKPGRHENDIYEQMRLVQYFTESYKRACKIAYNYSK